MSKELAEQNKLQYFTPMIRFKQYIQEAFTSSFPIKKMSGISTKRHHFYTFKDDKGQDYRVHIDHGGGHGVAEIGFSTPMDNQKSNFMATGQAGRGATRVISTVGNIMRNHAEKHSITHYTFNATDKEPSRQSLYNTISKKYGGASADTGQGYREYIVPTGVNRDT